MFNFFYFILKINKKTFQVHIWTHTHAQNPIDKISEMLVRNEKGLI